VSAEVSGKVLCRQLQETDHDAREDNEVDDLLFARRWKASAEGCFRPKKKGTQTGPMVLRSRACASSSGSTRNAVSM
jgi:hypothetical protein